VQDAQTREPLARLAREHRRAVVAEQRAKQPALLDALDERVDQVLRVLVEVPLRVAAQPSPVVEDPQDLRCDPLAVRAQDPDEVRGVVVQMPQAVHVLALEAAGLA
jgi:hypothetical protein